VSKLETSSEARTTDGDDEWLAEPSTREAEGVVSVVAVFYPLRHGPLEEGEVEAGAINGAVTAPRLSACCRADNARRFGSSHFEAEAA
jgi:hypothetical protein